ncbi:sugar ABC transporter permease [Candidatus Bipolaricaulota bacterium]|nr:sugar ABC transporter permease [Candidatus Bipolaricaulota bacterium]
MTALSAKRISEGRRAIPFLLPTILIMVAINLYPFLNGMVRSLHSFRILTQEFTFTGLGNFRALLQDELFWHAFRNSVVWVTTCLAGQFILSMILALVLNSRELIARRAVRTLVLIPWAMPPVVVALTWRYMLADRGPLNALLGLLGVANPPSWLLDPQVALWACILVTVWMNIPFMTVMLLAGLQSVEPSLYEAAAIDGAGFFQTTFRVTLPAIKKVALVVLTLMVIWTFNMFDIVFVLTNGGPGNASLTLPLFAYQNAFFYYQLGYAAAVGIVMMACLLLLIFFYIRQVLE